MMRTEVATLEPERWHSEVLDSELPVLVDFSADWCSPCRAFAPIIEDVAAAHEEAIKVVKVDIDEAPELASQFDVRSVPTLLVLRDGTEEDRIVGTVSREELETRLRRHMDAA